MGARHKLNQAYIAGAVIIGTVAWLITESALIFWIALLSSLAFSVRDGGIRIYDRSSPARSAHAAWPRGRSTRQRRG